MKRLFILLLFASVVRAQVPVTVTGLVTDAGNNPATSGYVQFDIIPKASSIHYFIPGFGTITQTVQCAINPFGQVKSFLNLANPCTVWGNDQISPGNTQYKVTFAPNGNITNVVSGECIISPTYSLNNPVFCPVVQISPQQNVIRSNPFQTNILPNAGHVFNIGSPSTPYAAVYADNLFLQGLQFSPANVVLLNNNNIFTGTNTFNNNTIFNANATFNNPATFTSTVTFSLLPAFPSQASSTFFAAGCGAPGVPSFRLICTNDVPAISVTSTGNGGVSSSGTTIGHLATWAANNGQLADGGVPPAGSVTSVNVTAPVQYSVTGCPITTAGTCVLGWNNQYPNTVLGGPSTSGLGGIFDGAVTGTSNAATTLPLTLKPNTASDIAFFHVSSSFIGQPSAVTVTGTGTWTTEVPNGNVGGLFRQLLTSSTSLTATANLTNATNFAGSMFFLQTSGTPVFVQNKGTTGGIVNGTQLVFTGNTTIGNAVLVVLNGTPPSAVSINATISDSQGNSFTPLSYVQNGSSAVATAWLATNIRAATLDTITLQTTTGTVGSGSFYMVEITNIAPQSQQPSFQILTPGHVRSFMQAAIAQVTTCPTVAAAGSTCTYTLTWPVPWPDATYAATCMGTTPVQFPVVQGVVNTTTTTVVTVENGTANEAQISGYTDMRCIGMSTH